MFKVSALLKKINDVTTSGVPRRLSCVNVATEHTDNEKKDGCLCPDFLSETLI